MIRETPKCPSCKQYPRKDSFERSGKIVFVRFRCDCASAGPFQADDASKGMSLRDIEKARQSWAKLVGL